MTYQSKLTDDIAEELATEQRSISVAEFFEKNRQMLGFDSGARALVTAVKEGVDNSLDACEEAEVLPDIFVEINKLDEGYEVVIEDNGPGIVREQIPKIFGKLLYGSRFGKRVQARGQQGIGISAAVLYSQLTSGKPARITSKTENGEAHYFEVIIDTDTNEPEITTDKIVEWDRPRGTRIEIEMEANMRARQQLHDYIKHTAVVNPHARIYLKEPNDEFRFERATDELPEKAEEIQPHPHGIELGTLIRMAKATDSYSVKGFLREEFTRVGSKTADSMIDGFRDRHYGREGAWNVDTNRLDSDTEGIEMSVVKAVSNKGRQETREFARRVSSALEDEGEVSYHGIEEVVGEVAEEIEEEFGKRFGGTVRENAVEAAWGVVKQNRENTLYETIDGATGDRKDDSAVRGLARRVSAKFENVERDRVTRRQLEEFLDSSADMAEDETGETFGEKSREKIVEAIWERMRTVPDEVPKIKDIGGDRDMARALLDGMRATDVMAPPTDCLSPITPEIMKKGLEKEFDAEFFSTATRDASVHGGDPFIVEAGIAYGGSLPSDSSADLLRFANRVPLVYQQGACVITEAIRDIGWRNYKLDGSAGLPQEPLVIMVHVASTNVPFTSESKDAIASVPEIKDEVELAVREVARDLKDHLKKQRTRQKRREKERVIQKILPDMAQKIGEITGRDTPETNRTVARILNKVYVSQKTEDGNAVLEVDNYSNSKKSFELHTFMDSEPALRNGDVDVDVIDMGDEYDFVWRVEVPGNESVSVEYSFEGAPGSVTVDGIDDELVEVEE